MRFKLALLAAFAVIAALSLAPSASAASSSIKVTTVPSVINVCRTADSQVRFNFQFKAKIKRRNSALPKKVTVTYTVTDANANVVLASGKVTLTKRNKWTNTSAAITAPAGTTLVYDLKSVFKAPNTGKKVTATATITDQTPTVADMDAMNPPLPACV